MYIISTSYLSSIDKIHKLKYIYKFVSDFFTVTISRKSLLKTYFYHNIIGEYNITDVPKKSGVVRKSKIKSYVLL